MLLALAACSSGTKSSGTTGPTSAPTAGPSTTAPAVDTHFTGQDSAAFCNLAKTYNDQSKTVAPTATPAQLRTTLRDGLATVNSAVAAAPAEIKADMQILATTFAQLADAFDKANYDPAKVDPASLQSLQSPQFQAATVRFQAYLHNVCGFTG
jgi:hypothetical protein